MSASVPDTLPTPSRPGTGVAAPAHAQGARRAPAHSPSPIPGC